MSVVTDISAHISLREEQRAQIRVIDARRASAATIGLAWNATPSPAARSMSRSFAPSPDRQRRIRPEAARRGAVPRNVLDLGVAVQDRLGHRAGQRGAVIAAARWPDACRTRASAATRSVKKVNPPETSAVTAPCARIVATSSRAPGVSATRAQVFSSASRLQALQHPDALAQGGLESRARRSSPAR